MESAYFIKMGKDRRRLMLDISLFSGGQAARKRKIAPVSAWIAGPIWKSVREMMKRYAGEILVKGQFKGFF